MRIIDRYLLRMFFKVLLICYFSLAGLFVVFDAFNNLDDFLAIGEREGGLTPLLARYYGPRLLTFFDRTAGPLTLMAAVFAITWLRRTNEYTALMAAGIAPRRLAAPLILAAMFITAVSAANRELVTPSFRDQLTGNAQDWAGNRPRTLQPCYDNHTDIFFSGKHVLLREGRIVEPKFGLPSDLAALGRHLSAASAVWRPASESRPSGYLLDGVTEPDNLRHRPSASVDDQPAVLTPSDTPWLTSTQCFVVSRVDVEQLVGGTAWRQFSSTAQLLDELHNPSLDLGADVRVAVHARLVQPLVEMTLFMLGLPLALHHQSRQMFMVAGLGLLLVAGHVMVVMLCHGLGNNCLIPPALAAWCPLLIFVPAAVCLAGPLASARQGGR